MDRLDFPLFWAQTASQPTVFAAACAVPHSTESAMHAPGRSVFVLVLTCGFLLPAVGYAESSVADEHFKTLDVNGDGGLSTFEYNSEAAIRMVDEDRNNLVSASELEAFVGPVGDEVSSATERIASMDLDHDGQLSSEELHRSLELRFKWMDKNEDGNVDLDEYRAAFGVAQVNLKGRVAH